MCSLLLFIAFFFFLHPQIYVSEDISFLYPIYLSILLHFSWKATASFKAYFPNCLYQSVLSVPLLSLHDIHSHFPCSFLLQLVLQVCCCLFIISLHLSLSIFSLTFERSEHRCPAAWLFCQLGAHNPYSLHRNSSQQDDCAPRVQSKVLLDVSNGNEIIIIH